MATSNYREYLKLDMKVTLESNVTYICQEKIILEKGVIPISYYGKNGIEAYAYYRDDGVNSGWSVKIVSLPMEASQSVAFANAIISDLYYGYSSLLGSSHGEEGEKLDDINNYLILSAKPEFRWGYLKVGIEYVTVDEGYFNFT